MAKGNHLGRRGYTLSTAEGNHLEMGAFNPDIRADADIRSRFQQKHTSASAGGYPRIPAL
ncbi:ATP-dependent DNA helicase sgs1 [Puccinia graminis f. sp. tritici]|uniref:ATP-dependent DNA helicase sgs1 n=1 Tax=Puccinia graminis f. sp. tritici TaxID=56615 RepID=A0A5B0NW53_PUCGR|nr:ATP-dependent DNA helicase sgs1 [Puccinia graminis f. sp. tritici]